MKEGERILWLILVVTLKWPLKFFPLFMYLLSPPPPPPLFLYPPQVVVVVVVVAMAVVS